MSAHKNQLDRCMIYNINKPTRFIFAFTVGLIFPLVGIGLYMGLNDIDTAHWFGVGALVGIGINILFIIISTLTLGYVPGI